MINELGHFALILAFAVAIIQVVVPTVGIFKNDNGVKYVASVAALGQAWLLTVAFACLTYSFVVSDFSVRLVFLNSHSLKPMIYKISGVWGTKVQCCYGATFLPYLARLRWYLARGCLLG